jgi:hypothetical protein
MENAKSWLMVLMMAMVAAPALALGPHIVVDKTVHDAGIVRPGTPIDAEFVVSNSGDGELTLEVRASCGCTDVNYDNVIKPGQRGRIHAVIKTERLSGEVSKAILVVSNDAQRPTLRLELRARVDPALRFTPGPLVQLSSEQGIEASASIVLEATDDSVRDFAVNKVAPAQPYVRAEARRIDGGPEVRPRWEITVRLTADAPQGVVNVPVQVVTDLPEAAELAFRVVGSVTSNARHLAEHDVES